MIDTSYFVGEIYLSQVGKSASKQVNNNNSLQGFIDEGEVAVMDMALGKETSKEFFDQFTDYGDLKSGSDIKWEYLIYGHSYTYRDKSYFWEGLTKTNGVLKSSLIAYYVFYKYKESTLTQEGTMGTVKVAATNANVAAALPKMTNAWRKFFQWYQGNHCNTPNISHFSRGIYVDYYGGSESRDVSLYTYLQHQKESFPNVEFTLIENKNQYQL